MAFDPAVLEKLRNKMQSDKVDAVFFGAADPHMSEVVSAHWKAVHWITGFTGSMGSCVVTKDKIEFWTDGRYTLQAKRDFTGTPTVVHSLDEPDEPSIAEWVCENIPAGGVFALDGRLFAVSEFRAFTKDFLNHGVKIKDDCTYTDELWENRPEISKEKLFELDVKYSGASRTEKIASVREKMKSKKASYYFAAGLDDIAWFVNLRGHDNPIYPLFHAYALIGMEKTALYTDTDKLTPEIEKNLEADGVDVYPMDMIFEHIKDIDPASSIYIDPFKTSLYLYNRIPKSVKIIEGLDFLNYLSSIKNATEQENMRMAHIEEGVAICRFIKYIKDNVKTAGFDEYFLGQKLEEFRKADPLYIQPSNVPIVAYMENAAMPHYRPTPSMTTKVEPRGFLLFDVCGHYYTGTTDLTRTIVLGEISDEMKRDYTLTLKSNIALATQKFRFGATGLLLDNVARSIHWNEHMHYTHGTGHGMGYILSVHGGPCKISMDFYLPFPYGMTEPVDAGMLFSNEPGVYKPGRYGIRLETNIVAQPDIENEFGRFLQFETLTLTPFEASAIDVSLLTEKERLWINEYHKRTYEKLSPHLDEEHREWLKEQTKEI